MFAWCKAYREGQFGDIPGFVSAMMAHVADLPAPLGHSSVSTIFQQFERAVHGIAQVAQRVAVGRRN